MEFCNLKAQYEAYKLEINEAIKKVLNHGKFIMGPEVYELEEKLAEYVGVRHCISVASGTDSLEIALRALGVGHGDEVITVPFTWISTAEVISQVGARPVFVDIDEHSYNMDPLQLEAAITSHTKAIIPVSLFGQLPRIEEINAIADKYNLPVIEDGAQSFGAERNGQKSCSMTTLGSTSFFPAKPFGCYGDGGALFTQDDELAEKCRAIRSHGGVVRHHHTMIGMNGRCDTIQAAILLAKLPHFKAEVTARNRIGAKYSKFLCENYNIPEVENGNYHVYGQYTLRHHSRDNLSEHLKSKNIPSAVYYPKCLHEQPAFAGLGYTPEQFPIALKSSREVISLPFSPFLSTTEQEEVVECLLGADVK